MFGVYFLKEPGVEIDGYETAKRFADTERYARFFHHMLESGFYFAPSQFEAGFVSSEHTDEDVRSTLAAADRFAAADAAV
jgi:glutamate-1-semialdehyde 2,1-aminomutase